MKKIKISSRLETIFSHAVALDQNGRFKNTIFGMGSWVYVLNYDLTVLLRFKLGISDPQFDSPIGFRANDYDSRIVYENEGKIVFEKTDSGLTRTKSCFVPELNAKEVQELFSEFQKIRSNRLICNLKILGLLESDLSHIEISSKSGIPHFVQRNIYDGTVIEIIPSEKSSSGFLQEASKLGNFGPIGIRTNDFSALFSFQSDLELYFDPKLNYSYIRSIHSKIMKMDGFISHCLYDEMGSINYLKEEGDGWEKSENRRDKPRTHKEDKREE